MARGWAPVAVDAVAAVVVGADAVLREAEAEVEAKVELDGCGREEED